MPRARRLGRRRLTADQRLVWFWSDKPRSLYEIGSVTGLSAADIPLIGIDYRVQDGQLYGVGSGGGIYTIDTKTGAATLVANLGVSLDGNSFGVIQSPPNNGSLVATGKLTAAADPVAGFDIYTAVRKGVAVANAGFASIGVDGVYSLYSVSLATGKATRLGRFRETVVDIAIPLAQ